MIYIKDHIKGGALTETTFLVLLALFKPNHGYGIMQFIEQETKGRVLLGAGTLYGAIHTLVKKRWIAPYGQEIESKKKEYHITDAGKKKVIEELTRLRDISKLASTLVEEEKNNG